MTAALLLAAAWGTALAGLGWRHRPVVRPVVAPGTAAGDRPRARRPGRPRLDGRSGAPGRHPMLLAAVLVVAGVALGHAFLGATAAIGTAVLHVVRRRSRRRADAAARTAALPASVDLLVVAVAAGLSPRQGLQVVAERGPPIIRPAFSAVCSRMAAGEALAEALPRLVDLVGEPARGLVRAVVVAERDGTPLRALLTNLADDAKRQRRQDLEAAIRRLPVRLAFPLVSCTLPAFLVLTVVPLLASGLSRLGPLTGGP